MIYSYTAYELHILIKNNFVEKLLLLFFPNPIVFT